MKNQIILLSTVLLMFFSIASAADSEEYFAEKWVYESNGGIAFIEINDVDGDKVSEVVSASSKQMLGGAAGWINILDKDKNCKGQYFLPGYVTGMAVADLNDDGKAEILASVFSRIHVIDGLGQKMWETMPRHGYDITALYVDDVNGDGVLEILAGGSTSSTQNELYLISSAGKVQWSIRVVGEIRSIYAADLYGDGSKEILVGTYGRGGSYNSQAVMQVFNTAGDPILNFGTRRGVASVHAADLDGDGVKEILVGTYRDLFVLSANGTEVWQYATNGLIRQIGVADIDGDSKLEVVLGSNDVFTLTSDGEEKWYNTVGPEVYTMQLADLNKDGQSEVVTGCSDGAYVVESDGSTLWEFAVSTGKVALGDLENDGYMEVAVGGGDKKVYLFQSETYAKEQEAYNKYKQAESRYNAKDYINAMKYALEAKELYTELDDSTGKTNVEKLVAKIEGDSTRFSQEESQAKGFYNQSVAAYVSGDYVNASLYAEKAKYKFSYLKDDAGVEKCNEIITNSAKYMVFDAEDQLKNASSAYDSGDYENALVYALKARANYAYLKEAENEKAAAEILGRTYYRLAEGRRSAADFENASVYAQESLYVFKCLGDGSTGCDPSKAKIVEASVIVSELADESFEASAYQADLLSLKSLLGEIAEEKTGNPLDQVAEILGANLLYITAFVLVVIVIGLLAGSIYLLGKKQDTPKKSERSGKGGLMSLEPKERIESRTKVEEIEDTVWVNRTPYEEVPLPEEPRSVTIEDRVEDLAPEKEGGEEVPRIKRDRIKGYGLTLKKKDD